jgi:hypothetical protein
MDHHRQTAAALLLAHLLLSAAGTLALADELCLTGNARGSGNLAVALTIGPDSAGALLDGSHLDRLSLGWAGTEPISLTFAEPVRISRVEIVFYNDRERSYNAAEKMVVTALRDAIAVETSEPTSLQADPALMCGTDGSIVWGAKAAAALPGAAACDALQVQVDKLPGAHQCLLRELYVWGVPERLAATEAAGGPTVSIQAAENTYSSIRISWDGLLPPGGYLRVRHRLADAAVWSTTCFTSSPGLLKWLRPDTAYELDACVVGPDGVGPLSAPRRVRLPHPLEVRRMGDLWGMNFYPGGGGAHQRHEDETTTTLAMIRLMRQAGVRHVRWFAASPAGAELFSEAGMSLFPFACYDAADRYRWLTGELGVWLAATRNEPDFGNTLAEDFVAGCVGPRAVAQSVDPLIALAGPAVGGELVGPGADYLADCYDAGLKQAVDVLDLHPYTKTSTPTPPGGRLGGPEGVLYSLQGAWDVMAHFGDDDRPVIVSEAGHPTHEGPWFMPPSSTQQQARYIVRSHLLLAARGIRRIYWYAFQDEGTDPGNPEHHFGIVDWNGDPKPAYTAYRTMTGLLSDAVCEGMVEDLQPPAYGVQCALDDGWVTALWDGGGRGEVVIDATADVRRMQGLMGEELPLPRADGGTLTLPIDESVCYVLSAGPLRVLSSRRLEPPVQPVLSMRLEPSTVRCGPGDVISWKARLHSEFDCPVLATVSCGDPWHRAAAEGRVTVPPRGEAEVELTFTVPADAGPGIISWDNRCRYRPEGPQWDEGDFRMAQFFVVGGQRH